MRLPSITFPVRATLSAMLLLCGAMAHAQSASCTQAASDACYFKYSMPDNQGQMHYYASEDPAASRTASEPTRVLIAMHGHSRDANKTFDAALLTLERGGAATRALVVAPVYQVDGERTGKCSTPGVPGPEAHDLLWTCSSWMEGQAANNGGHATSFAAMDALIVELKHRWPSLNTVTLAGFSAGGQFVQHYLAFAADPPLGLKLRFVVADPGTWLYFDPVRPLPVKSGNPAEWGDCVSAGALTAGCSLSLSNQFAESCPAFNGWKYGTAGLPADLARTASEARRRYADADISYLEGSLDDNGGHGTAFRVLDRSCAANSQGPFRLQRGIGYAYYDETELSGAKKHALTIVPGCAHDVACVFPSEAARAALLGPQP